MRMTRIIRMRVRTWVYVNYIASKACIKNEIGCRDDNVPKTVETRRHCEED